MNSIRIRGRQLRSGAWILAAALLIFAPALAQAASDEVVNSVIQGLPGSQAVEGSGPQNLGERAARPDEFVNRVIQKLTPNARPAPAIVSLVRTDFLVRVVTAYRAAAPNQSLTLRVGQVVPATIAASEFSPDLSGLWAPARDFMVVATQTSIYMVDKRTRRVHYRIDKEALVVSGPDPRYLLIINPAATRVVLVDTTAAQNWDIPFAYDSAEILPTGKALLAEIGLVLRSAKLKASHFVISGHTDRIGSREYNRTLSQERAAAVAEYLIRYEAIDPSRIVEFGFGFDRLKHPHQPRHPANRRVEILAQVGER